MLFPRKYKILDDVVAGKNIVSKEFDLTETVIKTNRVKVYGGFSGRNLIDIKKPAGWVYQVPYKPFKTILPKWYIDMLV